MSHEGLIEDRRSIWHRFVILIGFAATVIFFTLALKAVFLT